jgi:hypothetical protein
VTLIAGKRFAKVDEPSAVLFSHHRRRIHMFRIFASFCALLFMLLPVSCGGGPAGPGEVAEAMFRAAQERDYDRMFEYLAPEARDEVNVASLQGMEIVSYSIDEVEYSDDSTSAEVEFTIVVRSIRSGETDEDREDMDLVRNEDGEWMIVDM